MTRIIAFFSYTRADDEASGGLLRRIHGALEAALRVQWGKEASIFLDVDDMRMGRDWRKTLRDAIEQAHFFIPLLTPNYLASAACREELELFLEREQALGRDDLVWPVYLARIQDFKSADLAGLPARQRADWRGFYDNADDVTEKAFSKAIRAFAAMMVERLHGVEAKEKSSPQSAPQAPAPGTAQAVVSGLRGRNISVGDVTAQGTAVKAEVSEIEASGDLSLGDVKAQNP